jgi:hypothetical protein
MAPLTLHDVLGVSTVLETLCSWIDHHAISALEQTDRRMLETCSDAPIWQRLREIGVREFGAAFGPTWLSGLRPPESAAGRVLRHFLGVGICLRVRLNRIVRSEGLVQEESPLLRASRHVKLKDVIYSAIQNDKEAYLCTISKEDALSIHSTLDECLDRPWLWNERHIYSCGFTGDGISIGVAVDLWSPIHYLHRGRPDHICAHPTFFRRLV